VKDPEAMKNRGASPPAFAAGVLDGVLRGLALAAILIGLCMAFIAAGPMRA
jgi:hypothetical protein